MEQGCAPGLARAQFYSVELLGEGIEVSLGLPRRFEFAWVQYKVKDTAN